MAPKKPGPLRLPHSSRLRFAVWTIVLVGFCLPRLAARADWRRRDLSGWKAAAGSSAAARSSDTDRLQDDAADGHLENYRFLSAALIASGVSSPEMRRDLEGRFDRWFDQQRDSLGDELDAVAKARMLLKALHRDWCTGQYFAACARVDQTLLEGHFNCVTVTVLFHEAAMRAGLPDQIMAVPGHVYNRLELPGRSVDVQTTSATWLDPGAAKPAVPQGVPRALSEVQLIGKLYYNRGVALLGQERYESASRLFRKALAWDPQDRSAIQNLLAAYNNGALAAAKRRHYEEALTLLRAGMQFDPDFAPLQANYRHVAGTWVRQLLSRSQPQAARRLLDEVAQVAPNQQWWVADQRRSVRRWESSHPTVAAPADTPWMDDADLTTAAP